MPRLLVTYLANGERDQFGGDLPHLKAPNDLTDEFKRKMLYDNPVRFYRLGESKLKTLRRCLVMTKSGAGRTIVDDGVLSL